MMALKRYDAPNHPRWHARAERTEFRDTMSRWQSGRTRSRRRPRRSETAEPAVSSFLSRSEAEDDATVSLSSSPDWLRISAELPDSSLDDVRVTADDAAVRIRSDSAASAAGDGIDRTIALAEDVDADGAVIAYRDPTLAVVLPKRDAA